MHKTALKALIITSTLTFSCATWAEDPSVSFRIHHQYQSVRAMGMGDAFVAVANDYSALFYNPAGLARREDSEINLSLEGGLTPKFIEFGKDLSNASQTPGTDSAKQEAIMSAIQKVYGETYGFRFTPMAGIWARPKWALGVIPLDLSMEVIPHQQVGPSLDTTVYADTTVAMAWAQDVHWLSNARTSIGVTGKFVNRGFFSKGINAIEIAADSNLIKSTDLKEGYTVDADVGMIVTPEIPGEGWFWQAMKLARPSFGAVVRNIGEVGFGQSLKLFNKEKSDKPERLYRVIDLGSKFELPQLGIFSGRAVADMRDIMHPRFSPRKGLHLGAEFDWRMTSWWKGQWRVGVNQGYFTAGFSALLGVFNLDLATYGEDVGTYTTPKQNRVYQMKMSLNF